MHSTCTTMWLALLAILPSATSAWNSGCISAPVGFGRHTTGGAGGRTVTPKSNAELKAYLSSSETLIINLATTFDFTTGEGSRTTTGCWYNQCGSGAQKALPLYNACMGRTTTSVSYYVAGTRTLELVITSRKTVTSLNGKGVIKGKGIRINNADNVIVRDITISDINPEATNVLDPGQQVVWGGDAIVLSNVSNVWIHKCTIRNIGRQHLVTYVTPNTGVTVSSCLFDGTTAYSAYCDHSHYWMWLFWGTRDQVTLFNNRVVNAAGRVPHAGGDSSSYTSLIHLVGNEMDTNKHLGIQSYAGGYVVAEANKFISYTNPVDPSATGGYLAMVNTAAQASSCKSYFGQNCKVNAFQSTTVPTHFDLAALNLLAKQDLTAVNGARAAVCET